MIRNLLSRIYPQRQECSVIMLGLDNSGKTTLLYLLKLGQIVQTIPSMGFNVETVDVPVTNGKPFKATIWDLGMGCGKMFYARLVRNFTMNAEAIIWVVDAHDEGRLEESVNGLEEVLMPGLPDEVNSRVPILILANKFDLPKSASLDRIRIAFSRLSSRRMLAVYKTTVVTEDNLARTGLPEAFSWLQLAMNMPARSRKPKEDPPKEGVARQEGQKSPLRSQNDLVKKLESWLTRLEVDIGPNEFLDKFHSFDLPEWDHYTHIRIAYVILTKYGRKDGKNMIFSGLEKYIATNPQTKGKSFHVTMTYFWIQTVHFGIRNMPASNSIIAASSQQSADSPSPDDFSRFLLMNPHVGDGNLWSEYYTKDLMMSQKAKGEMVLPDRKPLPSLVIRDAIRSLGKDIT